jgi:hypothetical protein
LKIGRDAQIPDQGAISDAPDFDRAFAEARPRNEAAIGRKSDGNDFVIGDLEDQRTVSRVSDFHPEDVAIADELVVRRKLRVVHLRRQPSVRVVIRERRDQTQIGNVPLFEFARFYAGGQEKLPIGSKVDTVGSVGVRAESQEPDAVSDAPQL